MKTDAPIYEAVRAALLIDPDEIRDRERWTFAAANQRIKNSGDYAWFTDRPGRSPAAAPKKSPRKSKDRA